MPELDLTGITAARADVRAHQEELGLVRLKLTESRALADTAGARGDDTTAAGARAEATQLDARRAALLSALRLRTQDVLQASDSLVAAIGPEQAITSLSGDLPILLLPVRLETRFFDSGQTLKIRIFPDQAHVVSHDPALTTAEADGLAWYWTQRWPAPDADTEAGRALADAAWQGLAGRLRPGRAAFLVRTYPPGNLGSGEAAPTWPALPMRSGEWSVPAQAALLPDRWCVIGYRRDGPGRHTEIFRRWGNAVPDRLAAGPTPDPEAPAVAGGLPEDPDLAWLHDAAEAERNGMLVTVRQGDLITGATLAQGVDRLVVVGVDWTVGAVETGVMVENHFGAHAGEGRMAFVPQGVPTNSTTTIRSPYTTDLEAARRVQAPHVSQPGPVGSAGDLTTAALGLGGATFRRIAGADLREQTWQSALLEATWSAMGGYYLTEMLEPLVDDPAVESALRRHVAAHLRAGGPLPTLRIGAQPYGILPVMPRDRFEPDATNRAQGDVHRITTALRTLVEPLVATVPRLSQVRARGDVDDIMLALLQRMPVAWELTFRKLVGPIERQALHPSWSEAARLQRTITALLVRQMGTNRLPRLAELTHDEVDHPFDIPLVLKPVISKQTQRHSTDYLGEIRRLLHHPDGAALLSARKNSIALLEAFLACAAPMENAKAGKAIVAQQAASLQLSESFIAYLHRPGDGLPYTLRIEAAPVAPAAAGSAVPVPRTPLEFQQTVLPALTGDLTVAEFVAARFKERQGGPVVPETPDDPLHRLQRFDAALATLEEAPTDQLEWAFRGVLDLYSTRLDAWITSLATARLAERRASSPAGLYVGGWGVVEDLRSDTGPAAESLGFLHAPSLGQAASAAVLRSARLAHRGDQGKLFDLDLTSQRVRESLRVLEGVAAGQRLTALLGYRFERTLQERSLLLAQWILPLRRQCPLRSERPDDPDDPGVAEPVEAVAARDVVDGLNLLTRWVAEGDALLSAAGIPASDRDDIGAVLNELASLADGVSDVLLSESVHQATVGNLERSGAALAAHDRQGSPPETEFVRTDRAGPVVTHRVGIWLDRGATDPAPGWPADLRSLAEPRLDRWLGSILGPPSTWSVDARIIRSSEESPAGIVVLPTVGIDELGMSALSVVLAARRRGEGQVSDLNRALTLHYARLPEVRQLAPGDRLDLDTAGLAALLDLAAWAAETIGAAPLAADHLSSAADLSAGAGHPAAEAAADEAQARAAAVVDQVTKLAKRADEALVAGTESALLDALSALGAVEPLDDAVPTDLVTGAGQVLHRVRQRLTAAGSASAPAPAPVEPGDLPPAGRPESSAVATARTVVRTLLGEEQPFLPVLVVADPAPFDASLRARDRLLAQDPTAVVTWLHRSALVRPVLDPFAALLVHAEAGGADVSRHCEVVQIPHLPDATWVALPFGTAEPPPGSAGVVLHAADGIDWAGGGSGLLVDAWTETVPAAEETTAVTFHFDAPGARAPQAMLLAVHPSRSTQVWDLDTLVGCVREAVDLAQLRTLSSPELAPLSTLLPAIFLPDAYTRDTPGIRFAELAATVRQAMQGGLVVNHVLGKKVHHA